MHVYKGCRTLHTGMTRSSIYVRCYCLPQGCQCPGCGGESSIRGHMRPRPPAPGSCPRELGTWRCHRRTICACPLAGNMVPIADLGTLKWPVFLVLGWSRCVTMLLLRWLALPGAGGVGFVHKITDLWKLRAKRETVLKCNDTIF